MKKLFLSVLIIIGFSGPTLARELSMGSLFSLKRSDVFVLGETHDNPVHHIGQAQVLWTIRPKAVVFEMLTPAQAARITPSLLEDKIALEAVLDWNESGWPDFSMYYPIFAAIGDAQIFGAALPKKDVRAAFKNGAAAHFSGDAVRFGLSQTLPEDQLDLRMQEQFEAHCKAMPLDMMGGMVEAQRLRDAAFARAVVEAFDEVGGPVILIAGAGHAHRDWAVPAVLASAAPDLSVVSIAFLEAPAEPDKIYDHWIETTRVEREDPCLAFK